MTHTALILIPRLGDLNQINTKSNSSWVEFYGKMKGWDMYIYNLINPGSNPMDKAINNKD